MTEVYVQICCTVITNAHGSSAVESALRLVKDRPELRSGVVLISLEHPEVNKSDPEWCRLLNITSRRLSRSDPAHYVQLWTQYYKSLGNASSVTVSVYEFLSNEYRPSFVNLKFSFCDFISQFLKLHVYYTRNLSIPLTRWTNKDCVIDAGIYHFANLSLPIANLPLNFPFEKGRCYINHSLRGKILMSGYIDLQLKTLPTRKYKGGN